MNYPNPHIEVCLEGQQSIFRDLHQKEKEAIVQHHTIQRINRGEYLFREGDRLRGPVFLASGKAKLFRTGVGAREQILRMLKSHEMIGLQVLFTESKWFASCLATDNSVICILDRHCLMKIVKNNSDLSVKINRLLSEELTFSYNRIVSLTQKHVRGRLVESLLMLADMYGFDEDGKTINAYISRNDIAHLSNMTTSNAIRTLSNLAEEGNIEIRGKKISLVNIEVLQRISEQA